jgi:hypothetical protein
MMHSELKRIFRDAVLENIDTIASDMAWTSDNVIDKEVETRVKAWMNDISVWLDFKDGKLQLQLHWSDYEDSVYYSLDDMIKDDAEGHEAPRSYFEGVAQRFEEYAEQMRNAKHAFDENDV